MNAPDTIYATAKRLSRAQQAQQSSTRPKWQVHQDYVAFLARYMPVLADALALVRPLAVAFACSFALAKISMLAPFGRDHC